MRRFQVFWALRIIATSMLLAYLVISFSLKLVPGLQRNELRNRITLKPQRHTDHDKHPDRVTAKVTTYPGRFHVMLTFRLINDSDHGRARMKEYLWTLGKFLENDNVKQVHLMIDSPVTSEYIQKETNVERAVLLPNGSLGMHAGHKPDTFKNGIPHPKLKFHQVVSPDMVLTLHQFAFTHFQGELVVITQADIILGEGFEKVNRTLLAGNRLLYSLSRHESKCGTLKDQCEKYSGSHDTFVFVPDGNLTSMAIGLLNHTIFSYGTENLVMYVYQHLLNYRILNPCRILRTYHYHCTNFRKYKKPQKWVNELDERSMPVDRLI